MNAHVRIDALFSTFLHLHCFCNKYSLNTLAALNHHFLFKYFIRKHGILLQLFEKFWLERKWKKGHEYK